MTIKYINRDEIRFGKELKHRVKRLYPAYLFLVAGASLLVIAATRKIPYDIPSFLLSAQNFFWVLFGWDTPLSGILGHTWYITLDVYLFILWVLVIKYTPKNKLKLISYSGILIAIVWRVTCNLLLEDQTVSYTIPIGQLDSYCIGALVALNTMTNTSNRKYITFDVSIGLGGIIGCMLYAGLINSLGFIQSYQFFGNSSNYTHDPILVNIYLFVGLLSAGLMRFCFTESEKSVLANKSIVTLGNWSYELYLFHFPFIWLAGNFIDNRWLIAVVTLPLTIFTAFLWHKYAEERVHKLIGS